MELEIGRRRGYGILMHPTLSYALVTGDSDGSELS